LKRKEQYHSVDDKVIARIGKEKMRLIQLFRFWVEQYSRFSPDEVILRGDDPRIEDVREIKEWLED